MKTLERGPLDEGQRDHRIMNTELSFISENCYELTM